MTTKRKMDLLAAVKQVLRGYDDSHIPENELLHRLSELPYGITKDDLADIKIEKNEGVVKIMSVGRGTGEHFYMKALLCGLLSPMLYGFNIYKATDIFFNIFINQELELEIILGELEEADIDAFGDEIESTVQIYMCMEYVKLSGEDAKVEIITTWQEGTQFCNIQDGKV